MSSKDTADKMAALEEAIKTTEAKKVRALFRVIRSEKVLAERYRRLMSADVDLTAARWEFSRFCEGVNRGPCAPKGRST